jgi:hypothetical protein
MRRPQKPLSRELRWPFAILTGGAAATVAGLGAYIARIAHLSVNYRREPFTVIWGHRAVRTTAAVAMGGGALLMLRLYDAAARGSSATWSRSERWRLAAGATGAAGLLTFCSYWGVLPLEPRPTPPRRQP